MMPAPKKARALDDVPSPIVTSSKKSIVIADSEFAARDDDHPAVPPPRPYVFDKKIIKDLSVGIRLGMNILLTGPTGCGKTSVISAIANRTKQPMVRFNCDGETRVSNLRGMMKPTAKDGVLTLQFSLGDLAFAMQEGWWVLLDEIDAALPSVLFVLQPVLEEDRRELHVPEEQKSIEAHPDFRIFATGNTIGFRALARARHAGTNPMNAAFVDRFGMVISCDYPSKDEEFERIKVNVPGLQDIVIEGVARVADRLRHDDKFKTDFSTRRCVQWARLIKEFDNDVLRAAELAILRKLESPSDAKVAREIIERQFGYTDAEKR